MSDTVNGPMTLNEALRSIKYHAEEKCQPEVARLLRRLVTMDIAGVLPKGLAPYLVAVGEAFAGVQRPPADPAAVRDAVRRALGPPAGEAPNA